MMLKVMAELSEEVKKEGESMLRQIFVPEEVTMYPTEKENDHDTGECTGVEHEHA
jgi:hypothetical protein